MAENKGFRKYDLSSSTKWGLLSTGEHTVYIVAKADGYADSIKSATLTFTKPKTQYNITANLTDITADTNNVTTIEEGSTATLKYTANAGYKLPDTITVTGATHTWNKATGTVTLSNPTANVSITITGVADTVMISGKYTFLNTLTAPASMISEDVTFSVSLNNFTGECTNILLMPSTGVMNFTQSTGDTVMIYNFTTNTWNDLTSRKIDFGATSISVSSAFYTWLKANAHKTKTYNITNTLTNVTANASNATAVEENSSVTLRFTANIDYTLPDTITVTGATHTWDKTTGVVTINNPTADVSVTITGVATEVTYTVNYEVSGDAYKGLFVNGVGQGTLKSGLWTPSGNISAHIMNASGSASGTFTKVKTLFTGFCDDAVLLSEGLKIYTADKSSSVTIEPEKWKSHYADTKNFDLTSYLSEGCHIVWDGDT